MADENFGTSRHEQTAARQGWAEGLGDSCPTCYQMTLLLHAFLHILIAGFA